MNQVDDHSILMFTVSQTDDVGRHTTCVSLAPDPYVIKPIRSQPDLVRGQASIVSRDGDT